MKPPASKSVITDWTLADRDIEEALCREAGIELVVQQCRSEADSFHNYRLRVIAQCG